MYKALIIVLLLQISNVFSQSSKVKPKYDPNQEHKSLNMDFKLVKDRVKYMKLNMAKNIIYSKNYDNIFVDLAIKEQLIGIDDKLTNFNCLFTLKISANSIFVFLISNVCDFNGTETGEVNVTYFNYTYGDVDASSIKNLLIKKKRLYIANNRFTEELTIGKIVFTIYDKKVYSNVSLAGQNFEIKRY